MNVSLFFNNFNFRRVFKWLLLEFNAICFFAAAIIGSQESSFKFENSLIGDFFRLTIFGVVAFHLFFALEKDVNSEYFDQMNVKVGSQIELELLLENLEESIVIVEDQKLE